MKIKVIDRTNLEPDFVNTDKNLNLLLVSVSVQLVRSLKKV